MEVTLKQICQSIENLKLEEIGIVLDFIDKKISKMASKEDWSNS